MCNLKMVISSILLVCSVSLNAQNVNLSLHDAITLGLVNNLDSKAASLTLIDAQLTAYTVWNKFIPGVSVSGSTGVSTRNSNSVVTESGSLSGGADFSLSLNARNFIAVYEAANEYKNGTSTFNKTVANIRKEIAKAYYVLVVAKEELVIKELAFKTAEKRYKLGEAGYKLGEIGEIDKLRREYTQRAALYDYEELKNKYELSIDNFKNLLGLTNDAPIELVDTVPDITNCDLSLINTLQPEMHIGLENARLESQRAIIKQLYAIAPFLPSLSFGASLSGSYRGNPYDGKATFDDQHFDSSSSLRMSVSIPLSGIFPFSEDQVALIKAGNAKKKTDIAVEKEKKRVETEFKTTVRDLQYILTAYTNGTLNVGIAKKVFELTEKAYNEGTKEFTDLSTVEQDYQMAQLKQLQSRLAFVSKILDLEYYYLADLQSAFTKENK